MQGIDLKHKREIIVATILAIESSNQRPNKIMEGFCSEVISEQIRIMKKNKYKFKIFKKNGIFLEQLLRRISQLQLKHLYLIFLLLIELVSKINKSKANIKSINLQSLQLVQNEQSKQIMLQITNSASLHPKIIKSVSNKGQQSPNLFDLNKLKEFQNSRKISMFIEQTNRRPSNKRDIQIVLQKIKEIQSDYNIRYENQVQKQQFTALIKYCGLQISKNQGKQADFSINWCEMIEKVALKNNIIIGSVKSQVKLYINKIKNQNKAKVNLICSQLQKKSCIYECSDESDFSVQQDESHYIDIKKGQVMNLVENHTFQVKTKQYFKSIEK